MVNEPRVLLLDEPLSGLDEEARGKVATIIEEIAGTDTGVIYVTHRHDEFSSALTHIAVLEKGKMVFQGTMRAMAELVPLIASPERCNIFLATS